MNRFKGLDLIDRVPEELQTEVCNTVQESVTKTIPKKKKYKKAKWLSGELYKSSRKEEKQQAKKKGKDAQLNAKFQRIARRDKKALLSEQCKEIEETIKSERLEISSRKLKISRENVMREWAYIKDRNGKDMTEAEEIKKW